MFDDDQMNRGREFASREKIFAAACGSSDKAPPMVDARDRVMGCAERVHELRLRLANHNDRLFGELVAVPTAQRLDRPGNGPGAVGELLDALEHLTSQIDLLREEVARGTALA